MPLMHVPSWEIDEFERTTCALQQDYLKGASFMRRLQLHATQAEVNLEGSTDNARVSFEDRTLRSVCQNAVAISVVMLGDDQNRRLCAAISGLMQPLLDWHSAQIEQLRSAMGTFEFKIEQVGQSKFMQHIVAIVRRLTESAFLQNAGMLFDCSAMPGWPVGDIGLEDELAAFVGDFALVLASARCKRAVLLMHAWPCKMIKALGSPALAREVLGDFRRDLDLWGAFLEFPNKDVRLEQLQRRSCFHKTSVKQFVEAMRDPVVLTYVKTPSLCRASVGQGPRSCIRLLSIMNL